MKKSKTKDKFVFCITIGQELTSGNYEEALEEFLEILHQMGANDANIDQLTRTGRTYWTDASENLLNKIFVEVVKTKEEST
jgi:hypothetical protein